MPFILIGIILASMILPIMVSTEVLQFLYTMSIFFKSVLVWFLPWLIAGLLFRGTTALAQHRIHLIGIILGSIALSTFIATQVSYVIGHSVYTNVIPLTHIVKSVKELKPLGDWTVGAPLLSNKAALFLGVMSGLGSIVFFTKSYEVWGNIIEGIITRMLRVCSWLIPFFVSGFIIKMQYEGVFKSLAEDYAMIVLIVSGALVSYIVLLYALLGHFSFKEFWKRLSAFFPAAVSGFSTMSSAVSLPYTLSGINKIVTHKAIARSVVSSTLNIHLIGDSIAIPIFAFAILKSFSFSAPSFLDYELFVIAFFLAKFSVAAIPGGGIIVMWPILREQFHFTDPMLDMIVTLYILCDPLITTANILGNGALAQWVDRCAEAIRVRKE